MCVDLAKENDEDFVISCSEQTAALMNCTSENSQFFLLLLVMMRMMMMILIKIILK
jgi:hypothetical protein